MRLFIILSAFLSLKAFAPVPSAKNLWGLKVAKTRAEIAEALVAAGMDTTMLPEDADKRARYEQMFKMVEALPDDQFPAKEAFLFAARVYNAISTRPEHYETIGRGDSALRHEISYEEASRFLRTANDLVLRSHAKLTPREQVYTLITIQGTEGLGVGANERSLHKKISETMTLPEFLTHAESVSREKASKAVIRTRDSVAVQNPDLTFATAQFMKKFLTENQKYLWEMRPGKSGDYSPQLRSVLEEAFRGARFVTPGEGQQITPYHAERNEEAHVKRYLDAVMMEKAYVQPRDLTAAPTLVDRCRAWSSDLLRSLLVW